MAISTGDICSDAMADLQAEVEGGNHVCLTFANLCFIFQKSIDYSDTDMRVNFQDMCDYLAAQTWIEDNAMFFHADWRDQTAHFVTEPVIEPSTRYT